MVKRCTTYDIIKSAHNLNYLEFNRGARLIQSRIAKTLGLFCSLPSAQEPDPFDACLEGLYHSAQGLLWCQCHYFHGWRSHSAMTWHAIQKRILWALFVHEDSRLWVVQCTDIYYDYLVTIVPVSKRRVPWVAHKRLPHLISLTRALTILSQCLQCLIYKPHILLIDIETKKAQSSSRASTDAVQKSECLTNQVVIGFILLITQVILQRVSKIYSFYIILHR